MLPWLVTLGRNMSKKKCYSNNPSEAKLLDFDLSCPCCRQEFISSSLIVRKEETNEESDERAITAMGLLNTIETLVAVMEESPDVLAQLEPVALQAVGLIFSQSAMEYYEEALSLVFDLTSKKISPDLWKVLEMIYQVTFI